MRARPLYLAALLLAVLGLAAYLVVPAAIGRRDSAALIRAQGIAAGVHEPRDATVLGITECRGDNDRCLHVPRDVDAVTAEMAAGLRVTAGKAPEQRCEDFVHPAGVPMRSCVLHARTGHGHVAVVDITTAVRRVGPKQYRADGARIHISAG